MIDATFAHYLPLREIFANRRRPTAFRNALVWAGIVFSVQVGTQLIDNDIFPLELNTMPGWAGSSGYWMRYMDAHNSGEFASKDSWK
jgi:hypothetical protein